MILILAITTICALLELIQIYIYRSIYKNFNPGKIKHSWTYPHFWNLFTNNEITNLTCRKCKLTVSIFEQCKYKTCGEYFVNEVL